MRVRTLSLFYEEWLGKLPLSELERASLLFDIGELHGARYGRVKRLLDLVARRWSALSALAGRRSPFVLHRQPRSATADRCSTGRSGSARTATPFAILKFRTMRTGAGGLGNEWTQRDDPRITPFGRLLRRTHLDELPQVVNILRGDLSIVGPVPSSRTTSRSSARSCPSTTLRHLVRPGLTGWAQVKYGYAGDESDALEKLQYEFFYLRHQSLGLDVRIVGRTIRSVLGGDGAGR